jgi:hypothetical protein
LLCPTGRGTDNPFTGLETRVDVARIGPRVRQWRVMSAVIVGEGTIAIARY